MTTAPYTAETWPIAAAMLPFGGRTPRAGPSTTPSQRNGPSTCG